MLYFNILDIAEDEKPFPLFNCSTVKVIRQFYFIEDDEMVYFRYKNAVLYTHDVQLCSNLIYDVYVNFDNWHMYDIKMIHTIV